MLVERLDHGHHALLHYNHPICLFLFCSINLEVAITLHYDVIPVQLTQGRVCSCCNRVLDCTCRVLW